MPRKGRINWSCLKEQHLIDGRNKTENGEISDLCTASAPLPRPRASTLKVECIEAHALMTTRKLFHCCS